MAAITRAEAEERLEELRKLRGQGASDFRLRAYARKRWDLSVSAASRMVAKLRTSMVDEYRLIDHADINTRLIAQTEDILAQSLAAKQFACALGAVKVLAELTGLTR